MTIRELITTWGFKVDDKELKRAEKDLEGIKERLDLVLGYEVAKGLTEIVEKFGKWAEDVHVLSASIGITSEELQKLGFAAKQSGISTEEVSMAMARMSRHLYDARQGSEQAQKVFMQAGFSQEQIASFKNGEDIMLALADRFRGTNDNIKKMAILQEIAGRGSLRFSQFLSQGSGAIRGMGSEASRLGAVLGDHQVEALVRAEHAMVKFFEVVKAVGATIGSLLSPSIETAVNSMLKFFEVNKKVINENLRAWVWDVTYALGFVYEALKFVTQKFLDFAAAHPLLVRRATEVLFIFGLLISALFTAQKVFGIVTGAIHVLRTALVPLQAVFAFLGTEVAFIGAPLWAVVAAVAALVLAGQALWKVLSGGNLSDSWLGQLWTAGKGIAGAGLDSLKNFLGFGPGGGHENPFSTGQGPLAYLANASPPVAAASSSSNYQLNAPINITVPDGTDSKAVGDKVKEGVKEHLDRVYREAHRSLRPAITY